MVAILFALQAVYDSLALWAASIVAAFAVFVAGVVTAARRPRPSEDAARLDELEPLRGRDEDGR
ncbi:hypothetical protein F8568_030000 [Actinomadura sp. LD22]|uniref:Uncharacterized protein n=1 Tax=Actinomadura physcomitrii TaxID=2650748 RepID=A0A6I4MP16_9ACTN|nr:hypothetical protein [Actinomadura physcomitrii]MWA04539.1 hypothetical protein [Actinomadura physcomitrii]